MTKKKTAARRAAVAARSASARGVVHTPPVAASEIDFTSPATPRSLRNASPEAQEAAQTLRRLAVRKRQLEAQLRADVLRARAEGWSWDRIGAVLGVNGETLRRRYR